MLKYVVLFAVAGMLAMGAPTKPTLTGGSFQVDARHSDAQLITDATTDYGKTKVAVTLGFGRMTLQSPRSISGSTPPARWILRSTRTENS